MKATIFLYEKEVSNTEKNRNFNEDQILKFKRRYNEDVFASETRENRLAKSF